MKVKNGKYYDAIRQFERDLIHGTFVECRYNQSRAARKLGVSRGTLRSILIQHFGDRYIKIGARKGKDEMEIGF